MSAWPGPIPTVPEVWGRRSRTVSSQRAAVRAAVPPRAGTRPVPFYSGRWISASCSMTGWWWLEHDWIIFPETLGMSSSQLTNSYFSEGWLNHQPDEDGEVSRLPWWLPSGDVMAMEHRGNRYAQAVDGEHLDDGVLSRLEIYFDWCVWNGINCIFQNGHVNNDNKPYGSIFVSIKCDWLLLNRIVWFPKHSSRFWRSLKSARRWDYSQQLIIHNVVLVFIGIYRLGVFLKNWRPSKSWMIWMGWQVTSPESEPESELWGQKRRQKKLIRCRQQWCSTDPKRNVWKIFLLVMCYMAIEHGHRNSEVSQLWISMIFQSFLLTFTKGYPHLLHFVGFDVGEHPAPASAPPRRKWQNLWRGQVQPLCHTYRYDYYLCNCKVRTESQLITKKICWGTSISVCAFVCMI